MIRVPFSPHPFTRDPNEALAFLQKTTLYTLSNAHDESQLKTSDVKVQFSMAHDNQYIGVFFSVREPEVLGQFTEDGQPVYRDSCVEFFLETHPGVYTNFEMNCVGSLLVQSGKGRDNRRNFSKQEMENIFRTTDLLGPITRARSTNGPWSISIFIPVELLNLSTPILSGLTLKGNFYKCGDDLSKPHWLTYFPVPTPHPDFHRPEYFREITFE